MYLRRLILLFIFIFVFQGGNKIMPVLGQQIEEEEKIQKVVEEATMAFVRKDLDSIMNNISADYHDVTPEGEIIDYNKLKSLISELFIKLSKSYTDYTIRDIKFINLTLNDQRDEAAVEIEQEWAGFNLITIKEESGQRWRRVVLQKENGLWKIIQYIDKKE